MLSFLITQILLDVLDNKDLNNIKYLNLNWSMSICLHYHVIFFLRFNSTFKVYACDLINSTMLTIDDWRLMRQIEFETCTLSYVKDHQNGANWQDILSLGKVLLIGQKLGNLTKAFLYPVSLPNLFRHSNNHHKFWI